MAGTGLEGAEQLVRRASRLASRWAGPGRTGLVLPVLEGAADEARPPRRLEDLRRDGVRSLEEARAFLGEAALERGGDPWTAGGTALAGALCEGYFAAGGGPCALVLAAREPGRDAAGWIGAGGEPGGRTGLLALSELEAVGAVVLPPFPEALREPFLDLARSLPELFFFLHQVPAVESPPRASCPLSNAALLEGLPGGEWNPAVFAARVEALDGAPFRPGRLTPGRPAGRRRSPLDSPTLEAIRAWRRRAGLRRSLDRLSRWIVFEPDHALLRRRLEREVRAFLHEAALAGLVPPWGGEELRVRCEPVPEAAGSVRLSVRVVLACSR